MVLLLIQWLSMAAVPAVLVAVIDDWFLRPRRRIAALPAVAADPGWLQVLYAVLPVLLIAVVARMLVAERMDFSAVLSGAIAVAGVIWLLDHFLFAPWRRRAALARGVELAALPLPTTVDYAHSFLPVLAIVLVVRSFIFEPFRIPSDSMMPTLQDGDFIAVNKFAYGLRLPVFNIKLVDIGAPQRGDVVVFRYPPDPAINYVKRLVGLPGDRVQVRSDQLIINGTPVALEPAAKYNDGCYIDMPQAFEQLGEHRHRALYCQTPGDIWAEPVASCKRDFGHTHSYQCGAPTNSLLGDSNDFAEVTVPAGSYLMIGDNRDNSADGRRWGFVPEANLVGKATRIWLNLRWPGEGGPAWGRIGSKID
jgi:signal peptidase I